MKKLLALTLAIIMVLAVMPLSVSAAGDSISTATPIVLGSQYEGSITDSNPESFYKFTLNTSGKITISLSANIKITHFYLYNENAETVWSLSSKRWDNNTQIATLDENIDLTKGTYYFAICQCVGTGNYDFSITSTSANESFGETDFGTNNSTDCANTISFSTTYYGQIAENDSKDFYKFTLNTSGKITINLSANIKITHFYLYNENAETVWSLSSKRWDNNTQIATLDESIDLTKGTYYFAICQCIGTGNYNFSINCIHNYNNVNNYKCSVCGYTVTKEALRKTGDTWYYYKNGVLNTSNTLMKHTDGKWYHVNGGKLVRDTTLVQYNGTWYYVKNGVMDNSNTLCYYNGNWFHVNGGKYVKDTTLVQYNGTWYYIKNGIKDNSNTLCYYNGNWFHVKGGKYVKDTTLVQYNGTWYYVKNGIMNKSNTLCLYNGKWYHVNGGKWVKDTAIVSYNGSKFYVQNGVKSNYTGTVKVNGTYYKLSNGKVV